MRNSEMDLSLTDVFKMCTCDLVSLRKQSLTEGLLQFSCVNALL